MIHIVIEAWTQVYCGARLGRYDLRTRVGQAATCPQCRRMLALELMVDLP